ncbi:branched-chain amino acid ABC transporter permease [Pseudonocardia sp. RS010]|uniref:branched-chain amino acid ABC transporter permease n=1 Tax=Pseudonocardia sp. RS010 TaxID=3385979 RepID=UPI0039A2954F
MRRILAAVAGGVIALALVAGPFWLPPVALIQLQHVFYLGVAIAGLNLLTGLTGQISVGHGAFMGIGAYVTVLSANAGLGHFTGLVLGVVLAGVTGLLCGLPALRIRGMYLAMVTIGLGIVFPQVIVRYTEVTGGTAGLRMNQKPPALISGSTIASSYWILLIITLVVGLLMWQVLGSRLGRSLLAVRDNETAAGTLGVPVARTKVLVYGVSAALAGLAGWMFATVNQYVSPADFSVFLSINLLLAMVLGGPGTLLGPLLGGVYLAYSEEWIGEIGLNPQLTPAINGLLLILVLFFLPGGIAGSLGNLLSRRPPRRDRSTDTDPDEPTPSPRTEGAEPPVPSGAHARGEFS